MARWFPPAPQPAPFGLADIRQLLDDRLRPMQDAVIDLKAQMAIITDRSAQRADLTKLSSDVDKLREEMHAAFDSAENQFYPRGILDERYQRVQDRFTVVEARIKTLETRDSDLDMRSSAQRFSTSQNLVFWIFGGIGIVLTVIGTALAVASHIAFHP